MYDIDAIEAINFEQLATVTDRLLLRGRVTRRRLSTNKILCYRTDALPVARGSAPAIKTPDHTMLVKKPVRFPTKAAVLTSLSAIVISLVAML